MSLNDEFARAQDDVKKLAQRPANDVLLKLYGLYKQGTQGDAGDDRPGMFDPVGRAEALMLEGIDRHRGGRRPAGVRCSGPRPAGRLRLTATG